MPGVLRRPAHWGHPHGGYLVGEPKISALRGFTFTVRAGLYVLPPSYDTRRVMRPPSRFLVSSRSVAAMGEIIDPESGGCVVLSRHGLKIMNGK